MRTLPLCRVKKCKKAFVCLIQSI
ncbi:hypothetical protein Golob_006294 [Gossypium lobatum]|uniref:Uncharacterized protein n=1 Tax=Gossypium lobatum TaxID=34289 RepID=A0A7J8MVT2_9ROSI|nr:hypothetical protein [Gossypium lobatum]